MDFVKNLLSNTPGSPGPTPGQNNSANRSAAGNSAPRGNESFTMVDKQGRVCVDVTFDSMLQVGMHWCFYHFLFAFCRLTYL